MSDHTQRAVFQDKHCPTCYEQYTSGSTCPVDGTPLCTATDSPLVGQTFAERYVIDTVLGIGGMSIVFRATHQLMNRTVAIKMLKKKPTDSAVTLERFRLEAQAASSLSHQNIVAIHDFGVTPNGEPFLVMDCLEGESLAEVLHRNKFITVERALPIFKQICDGLDAAHKKGIVHRDLKPANVVLLKREDGSEQVKLVDFGIAKVLPQSGQNAQNLTQTGEVFGSPVYMSPEQCLGKPLDARADIYALGCLMYECLTGEPPFAGGSILETMNKHVGEHPKPLVEVVPYINVPAEVEFIIFRCLAKDPNNRFASAAEVHDLLSALTVALAGDKSGIISSVNRTLIPQRQQPPVLQIALGGLMFVVVGLFVVFATWPGPEGDRGTPLDKLLWQLSLSKADSALLEKDYATAEGSLHFAEAKAREFGDGAGRLEVTLKRKANLYDTWEGHASQLETVNHEIAQLQVQQLGGEYQRRLVSLSDLSKGAAGVELANKKLRAEAQLPGLLSTVSRLNGRGMYKKTEQLLKQAIAVDRKLLGADSVAVVSLECKLAECLIAQRKNMEVRPLLEHCVKVLAKQPGSAIDYIRALNLLGQFDLDQNDFKRARPELEQALAAARQHTGSASTLTLCLRSYADFLRQTGKKDEAQKLMFEADAME